MTTNNHETIGYRFISSSFSNEPKIGDILDRSFVWDGDEISECEFPGTCCFETKEQVEKYAKYSHGDGWIVKVGGDYVGRGTDLIGEIIIDNAEVLEVSVW